MASTYYAWSNFKVDVDEYGNAQSKIEPGETVTKSKLGIESDDDWEALVESGAVRTEKYPDVNEGESPAEYDRRKQAEAINFGMSPTGVIEELPAEEVEAPAAEPAKDK